MDKELRYGGTEYSRKITEAHMQQNIDIENNIKKEHKDKIGQKADKAVWKLLKPSKITVSIPYAPGQYERIFWKKTFN